MCLENVNNIIKLLKFYGQDDMKREFSPFAEVDRDWGMGFKYTIFLFLSTKTIKFVYNNKWKSGNYYIQLKERYIYPNPREIESVKCIDLVRTVQNVKDHVVIYED